MADEVTVGTSALAAGAPPCRPAAPAPDVRVRGAASAIRDSTPAGDASGDPFGECTGRGTDLAPPDLLHDGAGELGAAGGPGQPGERRQGGQRNPCAVSPLVAEPLAQGTAHHHDEDRGCGGEDHQRGEQRARHVGDPSS